MAAAQTGISLPGLMVVDRRDEDELPRLRGDGDDITEIAPLEVVRLQRTPGRARDNRCPRG